MKLLGKTKDGTIDGLLRAYVSRTGNLPHLCPDFDPDLANAYIERSLTADSRSRYEQHLSDCGACRKNVVALARLAEAEGATSTAPIPSGRGEGRPAWLTRMARGFSGLTAPQWATAVAAVIVLAISLPLILSRNELRTSQDAATAAAENQQASETRPGDQIAGTVPPAAMRKSGTEVAATAPKQSEKREAETIAANTPAARPASVAGNVSSGLRADAVKAKPAVPPVDEVQAKNDRPAESVIVTAGAAGEAQLAKNEADKKQKDSAQPGESKAAGAGEGGAGKEVASKVAEPPPPATRSAPEPARPRKGLRERGKLGLRDTSSEVARLPEKKILSKKFLLRDDIWTDKDYDPDKNRPVVNLVRDSNVYNEVLSKQAGLKAYLDAFREGERAIIVYKGKVYKLIPQ